VFLVKYAGVLIACRSMPYGDTKRKIFFFRLFDPDTGEPLNRKAICEAIEALTGEDAYFSTVDGSGEQISRAEVLDSSAPQCIRLYKVRRDELPGVDDGQGDQNELELDEDEGLSEAIHIRLFRRGVVGVEAFGHGPRAERFGRYLREHLDLDCEMRRLIRHDAIDYALQFGDIRLLRIKLDPSVASHQGANTPKHLEGLMQTADDFDTGVYADLTLRSEGNDEGFRNRVRTFLTKLKNGGAENEIFEKLEVEGKPDPDTPVAGLDLLSERLYRSVEIPYRGGRTRELDADAAFSAVKRAYDEVKDEVDLDALD
jgi:hypothetical protein